MDVVSGFISIVCGRAARAEAGEPTDRRSSSGTVERVGAARLGDTPVLHTLKQSHTQVTHRSHRGHIEVTRPHRGHKKATGLYRGHTEVTLRLRRGHQATQMSFKCHGVMQRSH